MLTEPIKYNEFVLETRRRVTSLEEKCAELQSDSSRMQLQLNGISRWLSTAAFILAILLTAIVSEIGWREILF